MVALKKSSGSFAAVYPTARSSVSTSLPSLRLDSSFASDFRRKDTSLPGTEVSDTVIKSRMEQDKNVVSSR